MGIVSSEVGHENSLWIYIWIGGSLGLGGALCEGVVKGDEEASTLYMGSVLLGEWDQCLSTGQVQVAPVYSSEKAEWECVHYGSCGALLK